MLHPASGTGHFSPLARKVIRFVRAGCTNRPFFHIVVTEKTRKRDDPVIEQLGSYDPIPNQHNEKLIALNYERIRHWIGNGAEITLPVQQLFGLSGFYPIHPTSYMTAWRNRREAKKVEEQEESSENNEEK